MTIFSTREWAIVIWILLFFFYAMINRKLRKSIWEIVKMFFGRKLSILWGIILLYVSGITMIFVHLPFWNDVFIKDIIIWFLFSGLFLCMNAVSQESSEDYIKKVLKNNLKLTIILEFILGTFTFNIWIELIIIPIITLITLLNVIAEREERAKQVHKLLDIILAIIGFWILYETIKVGLYEYRELDAFNTFISFMIPIVYLILVIPLEYMIELFSKYELLFIRMSFKEEKDTKIQRKHRWLVLKSCKLSIHRVMYFQKKYWRKMYNNMTELEFNILIKEFRKECNNKR